MNNTESDQEKTDASDVVLYRREGDYIPRIAAVHDLCGYGKCSLGVAIPVLSAAGCDVCPVPTGIFSSHTAYKGWYAHDISAILPEYLKAWQGISVQIDAVYSGFLGNETQVDSIFSLYEAFPEALRVVDPVMADHGKIYPTYTPELCRAMCELATKADVLTPNLTEAAIILGREWEGSDISADKAAEMIDALIAKGARYVVLKGIYHPGDSRMYNYFGGVDCNLGLASNDYLDYCLHGTGDVYCSCLLAALMAGRSLQEAVEFAGSFTYDAMIVSAKQPSYLERGVSFEPVLSRVCDLLVH